MQSKLASYLTSYGAYVPYHRLQRAAIASSLGSGSGKGTRSVASFDEDTTTMGVEAGRIALQNASSKPGVLLFATSSPAYLEKTNATAVHAALALPEECLASDSGGAIRSGFAALWSAASSNDTTLAVLSDTRTGLPSSSDEKDGGDAAAAFVFDPSASEKDAIAEVIGRSAISAELLDRWKLPGANASVVWEERFGEYAYVPLARKAFDDALKSAGITAEEIDHLIITGPHARSVKTMIAKSGARAEAIADDLSSTVGFTGAAHVGLMLTGALDNAKPGDVIVAMLISDGASALVFKVLDGITTRKPVSLRQQIEHTRDDLSYNTFLTWKGFLDRQPPRRPDPAAPSPPAAYRNEEWKYGLYASECEECGFRLLPPARVCPSCHSIDRTKRVRLADATATVATFTIDRLAYSLSPPVVAAIIDFDGGGRFNVELTDVDPATVAIGMRVVMTFRKIATAAGVHNYFWKGRPV
ncbi:MAG: OB-fold domain-containing protein [Actinomycetota bacterium]